MQKLRNRVYIFGGLSFLIVVSTISLARGDYGQGGPGNERRLHGITDQLNLRQDQKDKVEELKKKMRIEMQKVRNAQQQQQQEFHALISNPTVSDDSLKKAHDALVNARTAVMNTHFAHVLAIRTLLDDKQKKDFARLHKDRPRRKKERGRRFDD